MALDKVTYTDGVTVISASNLNAIQDAIIELENSVPGETISASVTQTENGATITITDGSGTTTATVQNGTATDAQVDAWLTEHPEATTTVQDGSITTQKLAPDVIALINSDNNSGPEYYSSYSTTVNILNNDGTEGTGNAKLTEYLPVVPGDVLTLSQNLTTKVGFYTESKTFLSIQTMGTGIQDYTVPLNAVYARFQNVYSGGNPIPFRVKRMKQPKNKSFFDLIRSPLKSTVNVGFTGDSNTAGYGLPSGSKSWANLFIDELSALTTFGFGVSSRWVECIGATSYSTGYNFKTNGEISIWTDASSITLGIGSNYSSAWKWLVDGVESGTASSATLTLDGQLHKVTVHFTGGQATDPYFTITKTISCENDAVTGVGPVNVTIPSGKDWLLIMIGTNARNTIWKELKNTYCEYDGKGCFIVPFPNHKTDSSYTHSQMETLSSLIDLFKAFNYEIINLSAENAFPFYDDTLFQSDKIHYSAKGHRIMANMISGRLGLPLYLEEI